MSSRWRQACTANQSLEPTRVGEPRSQLSFNVSQYGRSTVQGDTGRAHEK